jgi:hypothetical protein
VPDEKQLKIKDHEARDGRASDNKEYDEEEEGEI